MCTNWNHAEQPVFMQAPRIVETCSSVYVRDEAIRRRLVILGTGRCLY
jgi:hypothetical protein